MKKVIIKSGNFTGTVGEVVAVCTDNMFPILKVKTFDETLLWLFLEEVDILEESNDASK